VSVFAVGSRKYRYKPTKHSPG